MATKELIAAATVNRVISREGKVLGYLVKSNSNDDYYQVTGSKANGQCHYFCTCKAGANGFRNCKDGACCHVKAVKLTVTARRELAKELGNTPPATGCLGEQEQAAAPVSETVAIWAPEWIVLVDRSEVGPHDLLAPVAQAEQAEQVEKLDGSDIELAVVSAELRALYAEQAEERKASEAVVKAHAFAELKKRFDYRNAPVAPVATAPAPAPIAERGSLNGSREFSLLRR